MENKDLGSVPEAETGIVAPDGPGFTFTSDNGLISQLDDHRSVSLHLGRDKETGEIRYRLALENEGHKTVIGLSEDALDALLAMYMQLDPADPQLLPQGTQTCLAS